MSFQDHFSTQAKTYASTRPTYPPGLFAALAKLSPGHALAWDAGAGNGQASVALAAHFARVVATEPSAAQRAAATAHPRVEYHEAAETAPMLADASVDLVTVAQAVHWFDRPRFYREVQRVLRPGGVVALWGYELSGITAEIDSAVLRFYRGPIGSYWPPERVHIENGYRSIEFPFAELPFPLAMMELDWTLAQFAGYLRSWSAVVRYQKEKGIDPVAALAAELAPLWGEGARRITWPLIGRVGRIA
jgi:SAM-dependent methyltransferase